MLQQCIQMPSQWDTLPGYTDFWSTVMFFGTAMYSYEGQTMVDIIYTVQVRHLHFTLRAIYVTDPSNRK